MSVSTVQKRSLFRQMHQSGCFAIPNASDVGTAKVLASLGFKAIASTSAGFAWSIGKADNQVTLDDVCAHLTLLCAAVDIPVNADLENGFAQNPDDVGKNVARAMSTGVAGLSIEDFTGDSGAPIYSQALAVERIQAARAAIDSIDSKVLLVGRCEALLWDAGDLNFVIDRLVAYSEAGADCLFAPGLQTREDIAAVVRAVHPKPVSLLNSSTQITMPEAGALGVRRVSVGGALARAAWGGFMRAATELASEGTFGGFATAYPGRELNRIFRA